MVANPAAVPSDAFLEADAGFEYFTMPAHYQAVAGRILAALAGGGRFILLTGNPPPNGRLLSNALSKAATGTHTVIGVPCGHNLSGDDWRRLVPGGHDTNVQDFSAGAMLVALGTPLPLYVLEDADQLSDEQLQEFFSTWLFGEPTIGTAVLTVTSAFLTRLERPTLSFLIEGLAARMLFNHLGPDEVATFLRQQLNEDEVERVFSAEMIAAISAASGGDPALVNRLAGRALEAHRAETARPSQAAALHPVAEPAPASEPLPEPEAPSEAIGETAAAEAEGKTGDEFPALPAALTEPLPTEEPPPAEPVKRRWGGRRLVVGMGLALAYFAILFLLGTFIPRYFRPAEDARVASNRTHPAETPVAPKAADGATAEKPVPPAALPAAAPAQDHENAKTASVSAAPVVKESTPGATDTAMVVPVAPAPHSEAVTASAAPDLSEVKPAAAESTPAASAPEPRVAAVVPAAAPPSAPAASVPKAPAAPAPIAKQAPAAPAPSVAILSPEKSAPPAAASKSLPAAAPASNAARETEALVARGDEFLTTGDIISARLYYERAAIAGDGHAAMLMGETFDPDFLTRAGVRGVRGDPEIAAMWYRRAKELGDRDAARRIEQLKLN